MTLFRSDRYRWPVGLVVACYIVSAVMYAVVTPIFENPDESSHLQVIRYIGREKKLPPYQIPDRRADTAQNMAWLIGHHDPPLYYAPPLYHTLGAILTAWTEMDDLPDRLIPSLSWQAGYSPQRGADPWNKNVFVHLPSERLAESATVRATAVLRGMSVLLGAVTIVCTHAIGRTIWPQRPRLALLAMAMVALNPQFVAGSAGVSNDPLMISLLHLTVLIMLRLMRSRHSWHVWLVPGTLTGLGMLTKQSALMLLPLGALAVLAMSVLSSPGKLSVRSLVHRMVPALSAFTAAALLVGAGWYVRNYLLTGDVMGTQPHFAIQVPLQAFGGEALLLTLQSYWAAFGWALITAPAPAYAVPGLLLLLGGVGLAGSLISSVKRLSQSSPVVGSVLVLLAAVLMNSIALTRWATATGAPYGRLLFPTVGPLAVLLAWGIGQWRSRALRHGIAVLLGLSGLATLLFPWLLVAPAFSSPVMANGQPVNPRGFENGDFGVVSLAGYQAEPDSLAPGESLPVTLYWRADAEVDELLTVWGQLSGLDPTAQVANDSRWLGGTLYPSALWRSGDVVAHTLVLDIPDWAPAPALYWVRIGLQDSSSRNINLEGQENPYVVLGPWVVRRSMSVPEWATTTDYRLGNVIELVAYDIQSREQSLDIELYWSAVATPELDYTVFVHLVDSGGRHVAQHDGYPLNGAYPTSWWTAGEIVGDAHALPSPSPEDGDVALYVGMYDAQSGERLAVMDGGGHRQPDDMVRLPITSK